MNETATLAIVGDLPGHIDAPPGWRLAVGEDAEMPVKGPLALLVTRTGTDQALAYLLDEVHGHATPVVDFSGRFGDRADATGERLSEEALAEALHHIAPIQHRLAALPAMRGGQESRGLGILAHAFARDARIAPVWDPARTQAMRYSALFGVPNARQHLKRLEAEGLLERRHAARLHACANCGSSRLNAAEHCPDCGGSFLEEERLVHHYACGYQDRQSAFGPRGAMQCPKCGDRPRHFGVDYDAPGATTVCRQCGADADPPDVKFTCLDCAAATGSEAAETIDWFSFGLTDNGVEAVKNGRLPDFRVERAFDALAQSRSAHDFGQVLLHDLGIAARYDRPIAVARARLKSPDGLIAEHGRPRVEEAFGLLAELCGEALRETDLLAVDTDTMLIAMPETRPETARGVLDRLNQDVLGKIAIDLDFETRIMGREEAETFLAEQDAHRAGNADPR